MKTRVVVLCLLGLLVAGCQTTPIVMDQLPSSAAIRFYVMHEDKIETDNVIAVLSYTSSELAQSTNINSVEDFEIFFSDQFDVIMASSVIHSNYPVKPTFEELHIARHFMDVWAQTAYMQDIQGGEAANSFVQETTSLIQYISSREYNKYAIDQGWIVVTNEVSQ